MIVLRTARDRFWGQVQRLGVASESVRMVMSVFALSARPDRQTRKRCTGRTDIGSYMSLTDGLALTSNRSCRRIEADLPVPICPWVRVFGLAWIKQPEQGVWSR